ncbi:TraM recognition domain-containing protein [Vibrio parahaemolyticus]|uniref:TraM recognition domain-containing protein n=1 Tax=Vibrio parahaemolyticus TaxID=670 RepID=UPI001D5D17CB|nr:TraM recognition domain-containing protein [Vibrio parahaemolyticus]EGR3229858.1 phosphoesterase [Vibrio parahaemolyticus]EJG0181749.1 TraM recognition domain-containing protein [Vibrio parahaemolyticus]MCS0114810.1 TraM recognition domain-containing protein [Vibrio parahaemolyticus]
MSVQVHGVTANEDLQPGLVKKDTRTTMESFRDLTYNNSGEVMLGLGLLILSAPIMGNVILAEALFVLAMMYYPYQKRKVKEYIFHEPISAVDDKKKPLKGSGKGLLLLGNSIIDKSALWFSDDDLRTHMLVFGTTGSGKTRFLLGVLYQSMMFGSGCLYVDGKGDNTVWWLVFSFCRKVNKVDDLLVINYLTGEEDTTSDGKPSLKRKSNTSNPFAHGSSEQLRSLVVGLMRDGGGDDMWKGRASSMLGTLLKALTAMRNSGEINLDIDTIRDHMPLDRIVQLSMREDFKPSVLNSIQKYLQDLPGYKEQDALMGTIEQKAYEQHGYLTMQLTEIMADLAETYGHIFSAKLGEVDYKDVVFNRRVLFVILPSLEKDPDALAGLGKLVVAGVRSALAPALGDELEGLKINVIDKKPTKCAVPFIMIMDEYGYYAVKGFAVVAAQARSLGVSVVFAGQDYQSLKKASEEEAAATVANTNIKVCMKLEDPKETLQIMQDRAGEAYLARLPGHEGKDDAAIGALYKQMKNTQVELVKRMSLRDLVQQPPGKAHVINGDKLERCSLYFADPHEVEEAKLNKFMMVDKPSRAILDKYNNACQKLKRLWEEEEKQDFSDLESDPGIVQLISDLNMCIDHKLSVSDSAQMAIGTYELREVMRDEILNAKSLEDNAPKSAKPAVKAAPKATAKPVSSKEVVASKESVKAEEKTAKPAEAKQTDASSNAEKEPTAKEILDIAKSKVMNEGEEKSSTEVKTKEQEIAEEMESGYLDVVQEQNRPDLSIRESVESIETSFVERLMKTVEQGAGEKVDVSNTLIELERLGGKNVVASESEAEKGIGFISKKFAFDDYAEDPIPEKQSQDSLKMLLNNLTSKIKV